MPSLLKSASPAVAKQGVAGLGGLLQLGEGLLQGGLVADLDPPVALFTEMLLR